MADDDSEDTVTLIVNADDVGYAEERDRGIFELLQAGCVSRVSLLVNGASAGISRTRASAWTGRRLLMCQTTFRW